MSRRMVESLAERTGDDVAYRVTQAVREGAKEEANALLTERQLASQRDSVARAIVRLQKARKDFNPDIRRGAAIFILLELAEALGAGDVLRREVEATLGKKEGACPFDPR